MKDFVRNCGVCQKYKLETLAPAGFLSPLPIPDVVWKDITMDFIVGLPKSCGKDMVLVVVDQLTKLAHFIPMVHPIPVVQVAGNFLGNVYKLYGLPRSIVCDRDPIFISKFWQELFRL